MAMMVMMVMVVVDSSETSAVRTEESVSHETNNQPADSLQSTLTATSASTGLMTR